MNGADNLSPLRMDLKRPRSKPESFSPAFGGGWNSPGSPGLLSPSPLGRAGCCADGPHEVAALPTEPACLPAPAATRREDGESGAGEKTHSALLPSIPGFPAIVYTVRKRHFVYAVEKEENNFQRHSLTVCQSNLLFPNDKRASTAGSKAYGLKRRSQIWYNHRVCNLEVNCDLKKNPKHQGTPSSSAKTWANKLAWWGSSQWVQFGHIKHGERQPNSFIKN